VNTDELGSMSWFQIMLLSIVCGMAILILVWSFIVTMDTWLDSKHHIRTPDIRGPYPPERFPRDPSTLLDTNQCPVCGGSAFDTFQEKYYELGMECQSCRARWGILLSPVRLVDSLPRRST
jgi:hypothetical protein